MIRNVRTKVHGESNAHNELNHGDDIQVDVPEGHKTNNTYLDGDNGKCHLPNKYKNNKPEKRWSPSRSYPGCTDPVRNEDKSYDCYNYAANYHTVDGGTQNLNNHF